MAAFLEVDPLQGPPGLQGLSDSVPANDDLLIFHIVSCTSCGSTDAREGLCSEADAQPRPSSSSNSHKWS